MPKAGSQQTLARQWEILKLIPSRGVGITAMELTKALDDLGFEVTKRTIERDLQELSLSFGLICNDRSKPYGWRWATGNGIGLPIPTIAEAVSINIVERQMKHLLPEAVLRVLEPRFRQAQEKLDTLVVSNDVAKWRDKVRVRPPGMPLLPPVIDYEILEAVQRAVLEERQIEVEYQGAGASEPLILTLHPLGLVQRGPVTYLVATAFSYQDVRLYTTHRFKAVEILPDKIAYPSDFSLDKYIDDGALEFGDGKKVKLRARIHEAVASFLLETPLSDDMKISGKDEWVTLTATISDSWQLRWWILSQGGSIEVLSPSSLRKDIAEEVTASYRLYAS